MPPVSILKPLKGVDDRLLDNLSGFCRLDYPRYELLLCVQGASDPALRVARKVRESHPETEISIVVADCRDGLNPKVNNMAPGYAAARYPFVLISDSNVAPDPGYRTVHQFLARHARWNRMRLSIAGPVRVNHVANNPKDRTPFDDSIAFARLGRGPLVRPIAPPREAAPSR